MSDELMAPLESVHRAFTLVREFGQGKTLSVSEAATLLGVAPSTAHRLLAALCFDDYAEQLANRRYGPGSALAMPGVSAITPARLSQEIRPVMERLSNEVNETIQVWILRGSYVQYLDGLESAQPLSVRTGQWERIPSHISAAGKSLLASLSLRQLKAIYSRGFPEAAMSRINSIDQLCKHLDGVRFRGYAINREEVTRGVNGLGVPILSGEPGRPIAALSIAVPTVRFYSSAIPFYAQALGDAATEAQKLLSKY